MKVLIFFPHPTKGGIERNLLIWLTCLRREAKRPVNIELFGTPSASSSAQHLGQWITAQGWIGIVIRYIRQVRKSRPDLVVCFQLGVVGLLARFFGVPVIIRLNNDPSHAALDPSISRHLSELGKRLVYRFADQLVANSEELSTRVGLYRAPVSVVRTPAPSVTPSISDEPNFLFVGRLAPQKNVMALIEAFAKLVTLFPKARLRIVGDGEQYPTIEQYISDCQLEESVYLEGWLDTPRYEGFRYFVLPSLYEGSPNALIEAVASGLYPVLTPFSSGGREVLQMLGYGTVASGFDANSLARAMHEALETEWTFQADGSGFQRFTHAYSTANACRTIRMLTEEVARNRRQ